jgi:hypothetical protein
MVFRCAGGSPAGSNQEWRCWGDAADRRDAHAGQSVDLAIRHALLQPLDDGPAVGHRLQFRRGAQVTEEGAAFVDVLERQHGREQAAFRERFLAGGDVAVLLHRDWVSGLMY